MTGLPGAAAGAVRVVPTAPPARPTPATGTLPLYDVDPDVLAVLVLGCPAVADLSGGPLGSAATYLPGRKVTGIRLTAGSVEVHPVLRYGVTVAELARQVRQSLAGLVGDRSVDIVVEDVQSPGDDVPVSAELGWPADPPAVS